MKSFKRILVTAIVVILTAGLISTTASADGKYLSIIGRVIHGTVGAMYEGYVEGLTEKQQDMIVDRLEEAVNEILREIDPHARLVTPANAEEVKKEIEGKYLGIGVRITVADRSQYLEEARAYIESGEYEINESQLGVILGLLFSAKNSGLGENYTNALVIKALEVVMVDSEKAKDLHRKITKGVIGPKGLHIIEIFRHGSAEKANLQKDWYILKIGGDELEGLEMKEAIDKLKGLKDTEVVLTIKRTSVYTRYEQGKAPVKMEMPIVEDIAVKRGEIEIPVIESRMVTRKIGYIKLETFVSRRSADQFGEAIDELKELGMEWLIFDLRDNRGGLLNETNSILGMLLRTGVVEFYSQGKKEEQMSVVVSVKPGVQKFDGPLVILVNEESASASEVVAGSVQDHERGKIIGTQTFGKGTVQSQIPLGGGYILRVTLAKWYTPHGRNVHGVGIAPDIEIEDDQKTPQDEVLLKAIEVLNADAE